MYPEVVVPVAFFILVAFIIKYVLDHKTRQQLIEKGLVDDKVKHLYQGISVTKTLSSLKWGMLLLAIGAAVLIGRSIEKYRYGDDIRPATLALMLILGGAALVIFYFIEARVQKRSREEESRRM